MFAVLTQNCVMKLIWTLSPKMERIILETELREGQSTANQLTHQKRELQDVINSVGLNTSKILRQQVVQGQSTLPVRFVFS